MKWTILRCLVISLVLAFVASIVSTSVMLALPSGTLVPLDEVEDVRAAEASGELDGYLLGVSTRTITGMERFTRTFSHARYWQFQRQAMLGMFITLFIGTLLAVAWNSRAGQRNNDL